ncbi:beta-N-acetylhexosaminidase [Bacteroides helcogenes]|uniref:beta-N-acetylhexosaminidase n=1 Tax=Bacteroides helcogenes (strain ATCC 35417 / DSM 20613 / JCM 6297 / CCUG 15421 / P 36-108) TaxID=693979 RepID=E6SRW3_BACT6|nr:beta-N-acetylhexosaminidase [Bacteroides helcogenes]ADV42122.1 Beta-N-acetylhexosaminidase [Bacteroides helcogenes P 36-108]MDY5240069.1 beta-N-acetylhexosaminidase [Bacteroides helcogenes]
MKKNFFRKNVRNILCFLALVIAPNVAAQDNLSALLPLPNHIEQRKGFFSLSTSEQVTTNSGELQFAVTELQHIFRQRFGYEPQYGKNGKIKLILDNRINSDEQYRLTIAPQGITVKGKTPAGILYGIYTLDQVLLGDVVNTKNSKIQSLYIEDQPVYPYRALMLDPARHFLPIDDVKHYIRQMARYKYNVLQLHLSDDQGWRIEIKSHPKLTEVGAYPTSKGGEGSPDNGFYTQEQLKELVRYAANLNVEIIPEIDIPGHTAALLMAYPELHCDIHQDTIFEFGKTFNLMLSAANPKVYEVLDDIIREISTIFPSKKIHLGGDESAIASNWAKSPEHLRLMKEHGYTKADQLMNIFFGKVLASTKKYGLHTILWCELDNIYMPANTYLFDYPQDVTLVTWRNALTPKCIELTRKAGNALILAPGEYAYLDYPQYKNDFPEFNNWGMPTTTLQKTFEFDPTYKLEPEKRQQIIGVMGTLWGEAINDIHRATYMTYPRGLALAEAGWCQSPGNDWESFKSRMLPNLSDMMRRGVSIRVPFEVFNR